MILSENMLALLSRQYALEIGNSLFYDSLMSWADMRGFGGCAFFLEAQANGEREHAAKVLAYIGDRNAELSPVAIPPPAARPGTLLQLFEAVRIRESETFEALFAIHAQAESERDTATCAWLMQPSGLIMEQVEEERISQTILDRWMQRANGSNGGEVAHDMDVWIKGLRS